MNDDTEVTTLSEAWSLGFTEGALHMLQRMQAKGIVNLTAGERLMLMIFEATNGDNPFKEGS